MTRVGLLVEPGFLDHHVGVRNYILTLAAYLGGVADVRLISSFRPYNHAPNWFRIHLTDPSFAENNGVTQNWCLHAPAGDMLAAFAAGPPPGSVAGPPLWYSQIGTRLESLELDALVLTNPWLVNFTDRLPVKRQLGIVYDAIPNRYCLTAPGKPFEFAAQHLNGFRYFRTHCQATLAISPASARDMVSLFHFDENQVQSLPPLVPTSCLKPMQNSVARRPGTVLLASPLDRRKGLAEIPGLLKGLGQNLTTLLIYGGVRCSPDELSTFFTELPAQLPVEWYPRATAATTERLFREAKVLVFPSLNEGLGLPILEAQLRGCPVLARDIPPMNELLVTGSERMTSHGEDDVKILRKMVNATQFNHAELEQSARAFFNTDQLATRVQSIVLGN